jgi:hypothetical protein
VTDSGPAPSPAERGALGGRVAFVTGAGRGIGPVMTKLAGFSAGNEDRLRSTFPTGEWVKSPDDVVPLALFIVTPPTHGPTGQVFSLLGRDG